MPSVTGAPFPECFETDTTDAEFKAVLARVDADIANNDRILAEMKLKHLETTVAALKTLVEAQRDALANQREALNKRRPVTDEKPVVSCYAEVREIVRMLHDGISSTDVIYKDLCLTIALRSVRDLVNVLCEKTDNTGGAVIGIGTRALLDDALAKKPEPAIAVDLDAPMRKWREANK